MIVLHAHWQAPRDPEDPGGLLVWAETAEGRSPAKQRGRLAAEPRPKPHPYSLAADDLRHLAPLSAEDGICASARAGEALLRLPATRSGPTPSPELWHDWDLDEKTPPFLAPWTVEGLRLMPAEGLRLLGTLPAEHPQPGRLHLGADLRFWQHARDLLLEGVAAQKVVPLALEVGGAAQARWLLLLDGPEDGPRLARLRAAMPPVCRAEVDPQGRSLGPRQLLETFLNSSADALVRQAAAALPRPGSQAGSGEAHRLWLDALLADSPGFAPSAAQLDALLRAQQAWLRNLQVAGDEAFCIAFRLEAPLQRLAAEANGAEGETEAATIEEAEASAGRDWQLHFLLQSREDPSLLVPVGVLWDAQSGRSLDWLDRDGSAPQEQLLAGLAFAGRIHEPIARGLRAARPEAIGLDAGEAYDFLRHAAPLLEGAGFAVLVPPWWNRAGARLGLRLKLRSRDSGSGDAVASGGMNMDQLVSFRYELALGEERLSQEEFEALVALKVPLVRIRGQWVRLDPEQIEAAIRFWEEQSAEGEMGLLAALRQGLDEEAEKAGLPVDSVEAEGWLEEWLGRTGRPETLEALAEPPGLEARLRPYQRRGLSWLAFLRGQGLGACLADDMGLGKTIQTIALILHERARLGALPGPTLLVCPTSVVTNWRRELERFAPSLDLLVYQGPERPRGAALAEAAAGVNLVLTSYTLVRRDLEALGDIDWHGLVLDEAQNIKNPGAQQTRAIRSLSARFRVALTGTPVENRLSELWSILDFLNPGYLGSRAGFRSAFAIPIERYGDEAAARRLRGLVRPFILRRLKTDPKVIDDLPEKLETKAYCRLTEEQATLYQAVVDDQLRQVAEREGMERRGQVLSMLMQLKQICNHPLQFLHQGEGETASADPGEILARSGKLQRLTELLEELLAAGEKALIFTQYTEMARILQGYLPAALGARALYLHGGLPASKRDELVQAFQSPEGPPLFVLSLKAGGTGLNLTAASQVIHFDRWWNPAVEDQATDRAFRIGQSRRVLVHKFVTVGTLEEGIDRMIEDKRALAGAVVGEGEGWLTELSTDQLRELVTLRVEEALDG